MEPIHVVVFGETGKGKTTVASWLLNETGLSVSDTAQAGTLQTAASEGQFFGGAVTASSPWDADDYSGVKLRITDTPGLGDAVLQDEDIIRDIADNLNTGPSVHAFCLVIDDNPREGRLQKTMRMYLLMCDSAVELLQRLVVVVNRFTLYDPKRCEEEEDREDAQKAFAEKAAKVKHELLKNMLTTIFDRELNHAEKHALDCVRVFATNLLKFEEVKKTCITKGLAHPIAWLESRKMQKSLSVQSLIALVKYTKTMKPIKFEYALRVETVSATIKYDNILSALEIERSSTFEQIVQEVRTRVPELLGKELKICYTVGQKPAKRLSSDKQVKDLIDELVAEKDVDKRFLLVEVDSILVNFVVKDLRPLGATVDGADSSTTKPVEICKTTTEESVRDELFTGLQSPFDLEAHVLEYHLESSIYQSFDDLRRNLQPNNTRVEVHLKKTLSPQLQELDPELRSVLKANYLEDLAAPLVADNIKSLRDLADIQQGGMEEDELKATCKALGTSGPAQRCFNKIKDDAVEDMETERYEKAQKKIRNKFKDINENYKEFKKFMDEAEGIRKVAAHQAQQDREQAEGAATKAIGEVKAKLAAMKLSVPKFEMVKNLPDLTRWLEEADRGFTPPGEMSAKDLINGAKLLNGVYLSPEDFCRGEIIRPSRKPVRWAMDAEKAMDECFQFTQKYQVEKTTEMMSARAWDQMEGQLQSNHASQSFHAAAKGAGFIGCGVGFFSASVDIAGANAEEKALEQHSHRREEVQALAKFIYLPQMELNLDTNLLHLTPWVVKRLRSIAQAAKSSSSSAATTDSSSRNAWDDDLVEFYQEFGSHISTGVLLGAARYFHAKRTFKAGEDRARAEAAFSREFAAKASAGGGYAGLGGAFHGQTAVDHSSGQAGGSRSENQDHHESQHLDVQSGILGRNLPIDISNADFKHAVVNSNGCWNVLRRYWDDNHLVPLWTVLQNHHMTEPADRVFGEVDFPKIMVKVYYRDVLRIEALCKSCLTPSDAKELEKEVEEALGNCHEAKLKELISKMHEKRKAVWAATSPEEAVWAATSPEVTMSKPKKVPRLTASKKPQGDSVFWPGDGVIYEQHWGDHNGWNPETKLYQQSSVSKDTVLTASKKPEGDSVFWPGDGVIYEQHWGNHNGWKVETTTYPQKSLAEF